MSHTDIVDAVVLQKKITLTPLRKEILDILSSAAQPLSAYQILALLKLQRPNAEPPTVYRVIDYLVQHHIIHKIVSTNRYICCADVASNHDKIYGLLFICAQCQRVDELFDPELTEGLQTYFSKHRWQVHSTLLEINGLCKNCSPL